MCKRNFELVRYLLPLNSNLGQPAKYHLVSSVFLGLGFFLMSLVWDPHHVFAGADWYVRLIVTAPDGRIDRGNVLGRDPESVDERDDHDLVEPPPPGGFSDTYLSIVFPHPEWGDDTVFNSDYRASVQDETQGDSWIFEVRTFTPDVQTTISWEEGDVNLLAILPRSRLLDTESGDVLVADTSVTTSYTVESTESVHAYTWQYLGQPPKPRSMAMPWIQMLLSGSHE